MTEQTINQPKKGFALVAFLGGIALVAVIWFFSSLMKPDYYSMSSLDSGAPIMNDIKYAAPVGFNSSKGRIGLETVSTSVVGNMTADRKVTNNYLTLHVKSASDFNSKVSAFVYSLKGKVMNEYVTVSSDSQSENGTISVLVPNEKSAEFFSFIEKQALKVVDRQVNSYEITQEYTDIQRSLAQHEVTYAKIKEFYSKAKTVSDLLQIQSQLDSEQSTIDSLKGRQSALEELSNNTQYTVYTSTNELDLPYLPNGTFEFAQTFKLAVRTLVNAVDSILTTVIYLVVLSPIFLVVGGSFWYAYKKLIRKA